MAEDDRPVPKKRPRKDPPEVAELHAVVPAGHDVAPLLPAPIKVSGGPMHVAASAGQIAETTLLTDDPDRAEWIARTFLTDQVEVTGLRRMCGFTGHRNNKRISVMAVGIGAPSATVYATELLKHYGVKKLLYIGGCASGRRDVDVGDLVLGMSASTDSGMQPALFATQRARYHLAPCADFAMLRKATHRAEQNGVRYHCGGLFSTDCFYETDPDLKDLLWRSGFLGIEMQTAAIYAAASLFGRRALALCIVEKCSRADAATRFSLEEWHAKLQAVVEVALDVVAAS